MSAHRLDHKYRLYQFLVGFVKIRSTQDLVGVRDPHVRNDTNDPNYRRPMPAVIFDRDLRSTVFVVQGKTQVLWPSFYGINPPPASDRSSAEGRGRGLQIPSGRILVRLLA